MKKQRFILALTGLSHQIVDQNRASSKKKTARSRFALSRSRLELLISKIFFNFSGSTISISSLMLTYLPDTSISNVQR